MKAMAPHHGTASRSATLRLPFWVAVFAALLAAVVLPANSAAAAAGPCWNEYDTYKAAPGQTVHAYAFKECTTDEPPLGMSVSLQSNICDFYGCFWVTIRSGYGHVSYACTGDYYEDIRSTRLPSKVIRCLPT